MSVKFDNSKIMSALKAKQVKLARLPEEARREFVKNTPIKTGNARSKTSLENKNTIVADYPYAARLDDGYSNQSPDGMVKPTEMFVKQRFIDIMAGKK